MKGKGASVEQKAEGRNRMQENRLMIDNPEHVTSSLHAVSLAENVVSHLIGGGSAHACEIRNFSGDEQFDSELPKGSSATWYIHRGESSFGVEISKLLPCESPLMRSRSLFEVARAFRSGADQGELPAGTWEIDGTLSEESQIVNVTTGLGNILVAVEQVKEEELNTRKGLSKIGPTLVSLPMVVSPILQGSLQEWIGPLSTLQGPLSLITHGPVTVRVLQEYYTIKDDLVCGGIIMQRAEESIGEGHLGIEGVLDGSEGEIDGDATLSISIHLGEIQVTLAQLARLRKGHSLRLREENLSSDGGFSCALTLGSTRLASGKLRFSGDRVVLTIAEVV